MPMSKKTCSAKSVPAFAFDTPFAGCRNQLLGALHAVYPEHPAEKCLLPVLDADKQPISLCYANYKNYAAFRSLALECLGTKHVQCYKADNRTPKSTQEAIEGKIC